MLLLLQQQTTKPKKDGPTQKLGKTWRANKIQTENEEDWTDFQQQQSLHESHNKTRIAPAEINRDTKC
jgi:hypothetical protein